VSLLGQSFNNKKNIEMMRTEIKKKIEII